MGSADHELNAVMRGALKGDGQSGTELRQSLSWLVATPEAYQTRVADFDLINGRLNVLMQNPEGLGPEYEHVRSLAADFNGQTIPSLEEAREKFYTDAATAQLVSETIRNAAHNYPEWAIESHPTDTKATPASGALIEGFGAFLAGFIKGAHPDLSRHYVLAFESVLINERAESPLLTDVLGWMKEERDSFPEPLKPIIEGTV